MKLTTLILFFILNTITLLAQTNELCAKMDIDNGYRDIKLCTSKSMFNDLVQIKVKSRPDACGELFERRNENLTFGKAKASGIKYWFVNDILMGFTVTFNEGNQKDLTDFLIVINDLQKQYGKEEIWGNYRAWQCNTMIIYYDWNVLHFKRNDREWGEECAKIKK